MNPPELTDRENANLATHNQSLKFLTKFDTPELLPLPRIAPSLLHLKRKIAAANQKYSHPQTSKTSAELWLSNTTPIDCKRLWEQAKLAKAHLSAIPRPQQKEAPKWANLEFGGVGSLEREDFLFYNETRIAHQAVKLAVGKGGSNRAMHQTRVAAINWLLGKVEEESSSRDQEQVATSKLEEAVEEAVELDGKEVLLNLHTRLSVADPSNCIKLLAEQLNLLPFVNEASRQRGLESKDKEKQNRNCLFIIGTKFLEKIYLKEIKQQRSSDSDVWESAYWLLRAGKTKEAAKKLQNYHNVSKSLLQLEQNLINFEEMEVDLTDYPNSADTPYQSIIKLILKGTYQVRTHTSPLEEAWAVLMSVALSRRGTEERKERVEPLVALKAKINDYYEEKVKKVRDDRERKELTLGLISLGAFDLVLDFYSRISRGMNVNTETEFIHIFLLLAGNPSILRNFFPARVGSISTQAEEILNSCLDHIIRFIKKLQLSESQRYNHYLKVLTAILCNLEEEVTKFDPLPAIRTLCSEIFTHPSILADFSRQRPKLLQSSKLSKLFFQELLRSMKLGFSQDYFDLANFYKCQNQNDFAHHVLSAFIIREITHPNENPSLIEYAQKMLQQLVEGRNDMEDFLRILQQLKEKLAKRKREDLKKTIGEWSYYRKHNELLHLLQDMQARDGVNYSHIYLHYYEYLRPAYQAVYAITDRLSQAQQIGKVLAKELQQLKQDGLLSETPEFSLCLTSLGK